MIQQRNLYYVAESYDDVKQSMMFMDGEKPDFYAFLRKFNILNQIRWDEELIDASIKQVCEDIIAERIDFVWIRFTINKYLTHIDWHRKDMIWFVKKCFDKHAPDRVGLILAIKYESEHANQRQLLDLINDPLVAESVIGVDLVGDEGCYNSKFYGPFFRKWAMAGKLLFAHVGESQSQENIRTAITDLGVTEICHGIGITDPDIIDCAKDYGVCFHLALTSNLLTGVVDKIENHPINEMLLNGLDITIGTDDPVQCNTCLLDEYDLLYKCLRLRWSDKQTHEMIGVIAKTASDRIYS